MPIPRVFICSLALLLLIAVPPARALTSDELLLVVNKNVPEGMKLAEFYAKTRKVPAGRIVELDLPATEQMSFDTYEQSVVPPLRQFLRQSGLDAQIKCLVTFYGVPFRIAGRVADKQSTDEVANLRVQLKQCVDQLHSLADKIEAMATTLSPGFKPLVPGSPLADPDGALAIDNIARRIDFAGKATVIAIGAMPESDQKELLKQQFVGLVKAFKDPIVGLPETGPATQPISTDPPTTQSAMTAELVHRVQLDDRRFDPAARRELREKSAVTMGLFGYSKFILAQIGYLTPDESEAATDSELSLLRVVFYNRQRWTFNSLNYRLGMNASEALMVCRLDGPDPQIVRNEIIDALRGETQGLRGKIVIDSRGLQRTGNPKDDGYVAYDESLRRLAAIIKNKTEIPMVFDENPDVLPAHSQSDVALYCGWYSAANYIPACSFVQGAVGFHVASFEMVSLRDPGNNGWVRGLLKDGIAATLGPVSEPYLQSFPLSDEFFPLLLTGKLTLAEVYWKTEPMASWRQCLIGDPLYRPYAIDPGITVENLPPMLQRVFGINAAAATTMPTTAR